MKRILVIGCSGAGKSTLSTELAARLNLPLIHLDAEYWQPGWVETPKPEWKARVATLIERERWVMDGNYSGTLAERAAACDTVVLLDYPRLLCLYRVVKRAVRFRGVVRPDLSAGNPEKLPSVEFLLWIWSYPRRSLPKVMRVLGENRHCETVILKSPNEAREWLARVSPATPSSTELSS